MNSRTFVSTTQIPTESPRPNTIEATEPYGHLVQAAIKMGGQIAGEVSNTEDKKYSDEKNNLQAVLAEKDGIVTKLKNEIRHKDRVMVSLRQEFLLAIEKYRQSIITASPEIPAELIHGETVEQLESSLTKAKGLFEKIRKQVNLKAKTANKLASTTNKKPSGLTLVPNYDRTFSLE